MASESMTQQCFMVPDILEQETKGCLSVLMPTRDHSMAKEGGVVYWRLQ